MTRRTGSLNGSGDVYEGTTRLGRARYEFSTFTEYLDARPSPPLEGMSQIEGYIRPIDAMDLFRLATSDTTLTLHLEDGRRYDFFVEMDGRAHTTGRGLTTAA